MLTIPQVNRYNIESFRVYIHFRSTFYLIFRKFIVSNYYYFELGNIFKMQIKDFHMVVKFFPAGIFILYVGTNISNQIRKKIKWNVYNFAVVEFISMLILLLVCNRKVNLQSN